MRYKVGREKYEREKKKQEIKLRKKHAIESEKQEEERLKVIHHEAEVKRKKELKKKAMAAGSPARENRWMRIADEESRSFESYFMREAEKLIKYLFNQFCANKSKEIAITIDVQEETVEPDFEGQIELDEGYDWIEEAEARQEEVQTL